jgi:hypothetical protein
MAKTIVIKKFPWNHNIVGMDEIFFLLLKVNKVKIVSCSNLAIPSQAMTYKSKSSNRVRRHKYAHHVCKQFNGLKVLQSRHWSIVCDMKLHCDCTENIKICRSFNKPYKVYISVGRLKHFSKNNDAIDVIESNKKRITCKVFLAIISTYHNLHLQKLLRVHIRSRKFASPEVDFKFFIGSPTQIFIEEQKPDVVQLNVGDGYLDLASKITATMDWVSKNVDTDYVIKVDDDVYLNFDNIIPILRSSFTPTTRLLTGQVKTVGAPISRDHNHKWFLPLSQYWLSFLPAYTAGPVYILSFDGAAYLGSKHAFVTKYGFNLEDVLISILASEIDVYPKVIFPTGFITNGWEISLPVSALYAIHPVKSPSISFALLEKLGYGVSTGSEIQQIIQKFKSVEKNAFEKHQSLNLKLITPSISDGTQVFYDTGAIVFLLICALA